MQINKNNAGFILGQSLGSLGGAYLGKLYQEKEYQRLNALKPEEAEMAITGSITSNDEYLNSIKSSDYLLDTDTSKLDEKYANNTQQVTTPSKKQVQKQGMYANKQQVEGQTAPQAPTMQPYEVLTGQPNASLVEKTNNSMFEKNQSTLNDGRTPQSVKEGQSVSLTKSGINGKPETVTAQTVSMNQEQIAQSQKSLGEYGTELLKQRQSTMDSALNKIGELNKNALDYVDNAVAPQVELIFSQKEALRNEMSLYYYKAKKGEFVDKNKFAELKDKMDVLNKQELAIQKEVSIQKMEAQFKNMQKLFESALRNNDKDLANKIFTEMARLEETKIKQAFDVNKFNAEQQNKTFMFNAEQINKANQYKEQVKFNYAKLDQMKKLSTSSKSDVNKRFMVTQLGDKDLQRDLMQSQVIAETSDSLIKVVGDGKLDKITGVHGIVRNMYNSNPYFRAALEKGDTVAAMAGFKKEAMSKGLAYDEDEVKVIKGIAFLTGLERNKLFGSALTDNELKLSQEFLSSLKSDSPEIFLQKYQQLVEAISTRTSSRLKILENFDPAMFNELADKKSLTKMKEKADATTKIDLKKGKEVKSFVDAIRNSKAIKYNGRIIETKNLTDEQIKIMQKNKPNLQDWGITNGK